MGTKEKILTPADKFLQSNEYFDLKEEVKKFVTEALANEEGVDIELMMRLFEQQMTGHQSDTILRKKLFWDLVAENLKDSEFLKIHTDTGPLLEDVFKAEAFLNKKLREIIQKLSRAIYKNLNSRSDAIEELKARFYSYFPDLRDLIVGGLEGKKPAIKIPRGRTKRETWEGGVPEESPLERIDKKTWEVPEDLSVIKKGLIIEVEDTQNGQLLTYKITREPKLKENEIWVTTEERLGDIVIDRPSNYWEHRLADFGLVPYKDRKWTDRYIPIKWFMEEKSER